NIRHPLRNGFTAYNGLSRENGSFASLAPRRLLPKGALTPAPRRQDHTSLPYALMPFAIGTASAHRAPPHDHGDHDTPLLPGRDGCYVALIWVSGKQKYFQFGTIFRLTRFPKIGSGDLPVAQFRCLCSIFFLAAYGSRWTVFIQRVNFSPKQPMIRTDDAAT